MDYSTAGVPVLYYVLEFAEIHVHWWFCLIISSSATPFSFCLQYLLGLRSFSMSQLSHQVTKVLALQLQHLFSSILFSCSAMSILLTPWIAACQASLSITNSCSLLKLMFIESMIPASVFPMNIQGWFPLGLTGLISLLFKGLSIVFPSTTVWKHQFFGSQPSLRSNSHIRTWLLEKTIALTIQAFTSKVVSLLFNTLSRFAIASFPKNKCLLISWLQ